MSPLASSRRLTKNSRLPRAGVGQKSSAPLLTGAPALTGSPQPEVVVSRRAIQMSCPPSPPGRLVAMNKLRPSGERIGQPSLKVVLRLGCEPCSALTGADQSANSAAKSAVARVAAATQLKAPSTVRGERA